MKVKRFMTLTFLMLASVLLLVHAVLPHFHHDSVVCFTPQKVSSYTSSPDSEREVFKFCCNASHKVNHHHHDEVNLDDCDLKDIVVRQDNSQDSDLIQSVNLLSAFYTIYALHTFYLETPDFGLLFQEKPYLNNYSTLLLDLTFSLRGPPASSFLG